MSRFRYAAALAVVLAASASAPAAAGESAPAATRATCGTLPGEGAYSFIKTTRVSCKTARAVTTRAGEKFCSRPGKCDVAPDDGGVDRGTVRVKRWRCEMKVGYEFFQARCRRGDQHFRAESAA